MTEYRTFGTQVTNQFTKIANKSKQNGTRYSKGILRLVKYHQKQL